MMSLVAVLLSATPPSVAFLCAPGEGDFAELRVQRVGATDLAAPLARFDIVPRSTVTGAALPSGVVLAVAYTAQQRDETWAFSLLRLDPADGAVKPLVAHVAAASRPLVTADARVFVERGAAGPEPVDGAWRLDELRIDEVNPATGAVRNVLTGRGYFASLTGGALGKEIFVYRSDLASTRIEALNVDTREARLLKTLKGPLAFDFTVDPSRNALIFTLGDPETHTFSVERLDLATLRSTTLARGSTVALLPTVFPNGVTAYQPALGVGLVEAGVGAEKKRPVLDPTSSQGFERVRAFAQGYALGLHEIPSDFPTPFAVSVSDGTRAMLKAPRGMRLELVGVMP